MPTVPDGPELDQRPSVAHVTNTIPRPQHRDSRPYSRPHRHTATNTHVVTVGNSELTVKHSDDDISANSQHIYMILISF